MLTSRCAPSQSLDVVAVGDGLAAQAPGSPRRPTAPATASAPVPSTVAAEVVDDDLRTWRGELQRVTAPDAAPRAGHDRRRARRDAAHDGPLVGTRRAGVACRAPVVVPRQSVDEVDAARALEAAPAATGSARTARRRARRGFDAVAHLDDRDDGLAPLRVGHADHRASPTDGCPSSSASTSAGYTLTPPVMIRSALRSVRKRKPSLSRYPMSPIVW